MLREREAYSKLAWMLDGKRLKKSFVPTFGPQSFAKLPVISEHGNNYTTTSEIKRRNTHLT
jgi:hypothetical protein